MSRNCAVIIFKIRARDFETDLEIPLDISAHDLVMALNEAYNLEMDICDMRCCYLKAENPLALLKGSRTLREFGIRNGSVISHEI